MNDDNFRAASDASQNGLEIDGDLKVRSHRVSQSDVDSAELWLPNGTLFNDEAAERYGDLILERARIQIEQERSTLH
jgi:hypothetical protein